MATVIFSNAGDTDTAVLRYIWRGIPNVKLVEVNKDTVNAKAKVQEAIEQEHDTLICCGHGSAMGLFDPSTTGFTFLINRQNYKKIHVNRFIGVWCHASEYGESVHLKGFYSSMFISNKTEANMHNCTKATAEEITNAEILFCIGLNELIRRYVPMKNWVDILNNGGMAGDMPIQPADKSIDVVKFNFEGLKYLTKFTGTVPEYNEYGYPSYVYYGYGSGYTSTDYYSKKYGAPKTTTVKTVKTAKSNALALPKPAEKKTRSKRTGKTIVIDTEDIERWNKF